MTTGKYEETINPNRCDDRFPPASSFKLPLAVMAFDAGVLKDEGSTLKWDGTKRFLDTWNQDHTARTWMRDSVVWFSQELTPKIGKDKIEQYLEKFGYGNKDFSSGLKHSWLTPSPDSEKPVPNSLKISGYEQVKFLNRLWHGDLNVSTESQLKAKNLLETETSANGHRLMGKTGSGYMVNNLDLRFGWWVGFLETKKDNYAVVINITDKEKMPDRVFVGGEAKELAKRLLVDKKLWK